MNSIQNNIKKKNLSVTKTLSLYRESIKNVPLLRYSWVLVATICILTFTAYFKLKNSDVFFYAIGVLTISLLGFIFSFLLRTKDFIIRIALYILVYCIIVTMGTAVLGFASFILRGQPEFYKRWFPDQTVIAIDTKRTARKIILMDNPVLAYDETLKEKGQMNSHEIMHALSDLQVDIEIVPINEDVSLNDDNLILKKNPDLVIIHLSSFNSKGQQFDDPLGRLRVFLYKMIPSKTKFLVYTRWVPEVYGPLDVYFFDQLLGDKKDILRPRIKLFDVRNPSIGGKAIHIDTPTFKVPVIQNALLEQVKALLEEP